MTHRASGTFEVTLTPLAGLAGTMSTTIAGKEHAYQLEYTLRTPG